MTKCAMLAGAPPLPPDHTAFEALFVWRHSWGEGIQLISGLISVDFDSVSYGWGHRPSRFPVSGFGIPGMDKIEIVASYHVACPGESLIQASGTMSGTTGGKGVGKSQIYDPVPFSHRAGYSK